MIQLTRLLAAVDFSPHSDVVLQYAAEFSRMFGSEVLLCHVVEGAHLISQLPPMGEAYFPPNLSEVQERQARKEFEGLLSQYAFANSRVVLPVGSPFVEIVRLAREESVDLIVIGTHGRGPIAHMLLGSVAERVVRKAPCPVLTVRRGEHEFVKP
jgi:nucleotide-binding universal stress UspA family protein